MTVPLITVVLEPPQISDPANFEAKADALLNTGLPTLTTQMNASIGEINAVSDTLNTVISGAGFVSAGAGSLAISAGAKSLTVNPGLQITPGMYLTVAVTASPAANSMFATVTGYNNTTGALNFTVPADGLTGSGTYSAWSVALSGPRGAAPVGIVTSLAGLTGAVTASAAKTALAIATTNLTDIADFQASADGRAIAFAVAL